MAAWILILTMTVGGGYGVSIEHVSGFATEASCKTAGDKWRGSIPPSYQRGATFTCVEEGQ